MPQQEYGKLLQLRISRFQPKIGRPYEQVVKRRLDTRIFSTYKLYDKAKFPTIDLISYVNWDYWNDPYTIVYNAFSPYPPAPPAEP
jgi:hypothetical protein